MNANEKAININITFRNTEATNPIKDYATEKIRKCLQKFTHEDTAAHVVLSVEKGRHIAEVTCRTHGADFAAKQESSNLYASIDLLADSISQQLRKHKEKITSHH
jgi:putative sigma-54 modulation protein